MTMDSIRETESSESLRVRCPHCRKLCLVQFSDIQESKPRFECVQCRQRFWLSLADQDVTREITGLPVPTRETPKAAPARRGEPCPKCARPNEAGQSECGGCGVVLEKARAGESLPPHSAILATLWKKVIADYGDEAQHAEFLRAAQRERNLAYAGAQYAQMARLMPADETTARRVGEVQALAAAMVPSIGPVRVRRAFPRVWHVPLILATVVIISGMLAPMWRNLVGLGAALAFVAIGLRVYFRER